MAHFESEVLTDNIVRFMDGKSLEESFDGHTNCFIETGFKKAMLIDFNYEVEPLPGMFPMAGIGPMKLLQGNQDESLGQADVQMDLLEHAAAGSGPAHDFHANEHEGQEIPCKD